MIRSGEEILSDIDATLDQLIENASVIKHSLCKHALYQRGRSFAKDSGEPSCAISTYE